MREGYSVTVSKCGEPILTIERSMLAGKSELSEEDASAIRDAAAHLLSFIGPDKSTAGKCMNGCDIIACICDFA